MKTLSDTDKHFLQRSNVMNNQDTFQKIPVRKKPKTHNKNIWKQNRKIQRKLKQKQQEKFYG